MAARLDASSVTSRSDRSGTTGRQRAAHGRSAAGMTVASAGLRKTPTGRYQVGWRLDDSQRRMKRQTRAHSGAGHNTGMEWTHGRVIYAALGDSMSIDDYAGGPGRGAASLLWRNRDDDFPAWAGRGLTPATPPHGWLCWPATAPPPPRWRVSSWAAAPVGRYADVGHGDDGRQRPAGPRVEQVRAAPTHPPGVITGLRHRQSIRTGTL
jgi:hypothetical protein